MARGFEPSEPDLERTCRNHAKTNSNTMLNGRFGVCRPAERQSALPWWADGHCPSLFLRIPTSFWTPQKPLIRAKHMGQGSQSLLKTARAVAVEEFSAQGFPERLLAPALLEFFQIPQHLEGRIDR
jgi:hypothetical protein